MPFRNSFPATFLPSRDGVPGANGFCHWLCVFLIPPEGSPTLRPKFGVSYRLGTGWKAVLSNFFSISKALQRSVGNKGKGKKKEAFRTRGPGLQRPKRKTPFVPQVPVLSL